MMWCGVMWCDVMCDVMWPIRTERTKLECTPSPARACCRLISYAMRSPL